MTLWKRQGPVSTVTLPGNQCGNPKGARANFFVLVVFSDGKSTEESASPVWVWDQMASDTMPVFFLDPGEHTLIITHRESGSQLDQLLITNNLEYRP